MVKNLMKGRKGFLTGVVLTAAIALPFTTFAESVQQSIKVTYNGIKVTLNGESVTLKDVTGKVLEPFNYNGSVYVPIRGVSESLGMDVSYDSESKTVVIVNEGPNGAMPPGGQPSEGGSVGGGTSSGSSGEIGDQSTTDDTGLTIQVTQGPYYVTGTSQLTNGNLNYDNLTGTPIKVQGYVYAGATGTTPIAGAKVEIWHADDSGNYHPNSNGAASNYSSDEISLRGYVLTDENGYYEYTTIYPGEYTGRTRHIHTNTTANGYTGVITQLIIPSKEGDDMLASEDNIAQSLSAYNQVVFTDVNDIPTANFNYRLAAN